MGLTGLFLDTDNHVALAGVPQSRNIWGGRRQIGASRWPRNAAARPAFVPRCGLSSCLRGGFVVAGQAGSSGPVGDRYPKLDMALSMAS